MEKILFSLIVGLLISGCSSDQNNDTEERVTASIEKHANGLAYEYNQKKPFTGLFVGFDHNGGKKAEIHFKNGKQNGTAKMWYENGQQSHETNDTSGKILVTGIEDFGHVVADRKIVPDNIYRIRAIVSQWIIDEKIDVIISTGGTGVTGRDGTPEAITPLLDKVLDGFGETFRWLSFADIKTSTIQSRAVAGVANGTYIFCLPGSASACRMAWDSIIQTQLDSRTRPCNLVQLMPRLLEK